MSLILDALKRAERERRELLPAFANADPSALSQPGPRRNWWRIIVVLVLLGGIAAAAWVLQKRPAPTVQTSDTPAAPSAAPTAAATPQAAISVLPAPTRADAVVIPGTEGMISLEELAPPAATLPPATEPVAVSAAPANANPASPVAKPALKPEPEFEPEIPVEASVEPEPAAPVTAPPSKLTQPVPLRRFREMTPEYRADFPAITIEVHVYDRLVAKRWVMVNGRRYKEGERLVEGPALQEIVADGLVVEYRGEKLLYPLSR